MAATDDELAGIVRGFPTVVAAYLFGSRARGRARADSDIDVALVFAEEADAATRFARRCELSERLARWVGTDRADVVDLEAASPLLAHEVLKWGRLLYSRDERRRVQVVARQVMRYIDTRPMRRVLDEAVFRRIAEGTYGRVA